MAQQTSVFPTEDHPGQCCEQTPTRLVVYDVSNGYQSDAYLVCEKHWGEVEPDGRKIWQDYAKKITELRH